MSVDTTVCVVGGGLNGAAAALAVAEAGFDVTLIDRHKPARTPASLGVEIRNVALSPASRAFLETFGGWADGAPYRAMRVWEEFGTASLTFTAEEAGVAELGWIVEVGALNDHLWECALAHPRVDVRVGAGVAGMKADEHGVDLTLETGQLRASLVVAADGARSRVRELAGVRCRYSDTGHAALVTTVKTEHPHEGVAYQRFLRSGPLALLPSLEDHVSSVVWSQPPEAAADRAELDDAVFCAQIEQAIESALGTVQAADARFVFPLKQQLAERFDADPRVLLLGDAARVVHPLAGLGVNLGFEDAQALISALPNSGDPGLADWRAFARRRRIRSQSVQSLMDGLRRAYGNNSPWLDLARNMGVRAVSGSALIKRQIMQEAMGLGPIARSSR